MLDSCIRKLNRRNKEYLIPLWCVSRGKKQMEMTWKWPLYFLYTISVFLLLLILCRLSPLAGRISCFLHIGLRMHKFLFSRTFNNVSDASLWLKLLCKLRKAFYEVKLVICSPKFEFFESFSLCWKCKFLVYFPEQILKCKFIFWDSWSWTLP